MEESAEADPANDNKVPTTGGDSDGAEVKAGGEASVEKDERKGSSENGVGSPAMRPIFLGNLKPNVQADDITSIFQKPLDPPGSEPGAFRPIAVERLDQKRGYCFVFLKDAESAADKDNAERYIAAIRYVVRKITMLIFDNPTDPWT